MKKLVNIKVLVTIAIFVAGCFITGCSDDDFHVDSTESNSTLSKSEYEITLKKEIDGLVAKSGRLEESFFFVHGMPIWENSKWVNVDNKDILVVPLLSSNTNTQKHIVGVVENGKISAVITELSENRIFSLNNKILYDSEFSHIPRLKNDTEVANSLLLNGGSAQTLFTAANGSATYNPQATAGTLSINALSEGSSGDSSGDVGHAWITFVDNSGNITTFGTWGNQGSVEYHVNIERDRNYSGVSYSVQITYAQFQTILNYNATPGNQNWTYTYNCAGYAAGIWNAVTGMSIGGGILLTPSDIRNWINNH